MCKMAATSKQLRKWVNPSLTNYSNVLKEDLLSLYQKDTVRPSANCTLEGGNEPFKKRPSFGQTTRKKEHRSRDNYPHHVKVLFLKGVAITASLTTYEEKTCQQFLSFLIDTLLRTLDWQTLLIVSQVNTQSIFVANVTTDIDIILLCNTKEFQKGKSFSFPLQKYISRHIKQLQILSMQLTSNILELCHPKTKRPNSIFLKTFLRKMSISEWVVYLFYIISSWVPLRTGIYNFNTGFGRCS